MRTKLLILTIAFLTGAYWCHTEFTQIDRTASRKQKPKGDYRIQKSVSDDGLAWRVASDLDNYIEFHEGESVLQETMAIATRGQRAVYSCVWYDYEVCNGGHDQFFGNSTGILWEDAIAGFGLVGATDYAAILKAAISLFPNGTPAKDRKTRKAQLELIPREQLEGLDDSLYELKKKVNLDEILSLYIQAHPEEFFIQ